VAPKCLFLAAAVVILLTACGGEDGPVAGAFTHGVASGDARPDSVVLWTRVDREARFVDDSVLTSAGVASGMDLALHVVESLFGRAVADETARYIEYRRG